MNPNGTLQNVFVYVKSGLPTGKYPVPTTPVVLNQKGCLYTPQIGRASCRERVYVLV